MMDGPLGDQMIVQRMDGWRMEDGWMIDGPMGGSNDCSMNGWVMDDGWTNG